MLSVKQYEVGLMNAWANGTATGRISLPLKKALHRMTYSYKDLIGYVHGLGLLKSGNFTFRDFTLKIVNFQN